MTAADIIGGVIRGNMCLEGGREGGRGGRGGAVQRPPVCHGLHELIQQVIVGLAPHSLVSQPDVQRILQQLLQNTHTYTHTQRVVY